MEIPQKKEKFRSIWVYPPAKGSEIALAPSPQNWT
jgi:hypothetical protein